jgi:hypothetical protein
MGWRESCPQERQGYDEEPGIETSTSPNTVVKAKSTLEHFIEHDWMNEASECGALYTFKVRIIWTSAEVRIPIPRSPGP